MAVERHRQRPLRQSGGEFLFRRRPYYSPYVDNSNKKRLCYGTHFIVTTRNHRFAPKGVHGHLPAPCTPFGVNLWFLVVTVKCVP